MKQDYYQTLQIHRDATTEEVRAAFRRLALKSHPERNPERPEAARAFARAAEAFEVLSNPTHRKIFDEYGEEGLKHGGTAASAGALGGYHPTDPEVVFQRFFGLANPFEQVGDFGPMQEYQFFSKEGARDKCPPQCAAFEVRVPVTLEEYYHGAEKSVGVEAEVQDRQGAVVRTAAETLALTVAKGTATHTRFKFNRGTQREGWLRGDVVVVLVDAPHARYRRRGDDLLLTHGITLEEALTGFTVHVHTLDGRELDVFVNEIVHPTYVKRVQGEGMPLAGNSGAKGDLLISFSTTFPSYLTAEQQAEIKRILNAKP